ncbi:MAG: hypothetical protein O8C64_07365 [Candidatus Methanoperedens sp.]|nr:hypothetical protein [Candidatus Methanoperedens sp.]MCZ7405873.1 hypothetical protein [Candidatus Methanoperedens sp.]
MHDVNYYTSGKAATDTKKGLFWLKFIKYPFIGSAIAKKLLEGAREFEPKMLDITDASKLIRHSKKCAVGERVCRIIHKNSEITESVFLDELAEGMVNAGKARYVPLEGAIETLKKYSKNHPLILSQISKKPVEICCSSIENCIYWNMQRSNLRVFSGKREKQ